MRFQKSWFQVVSEALIRAKFTPHEGRYRWARKGTAGLATVEIWPNRTLRVLKNGKEYLHQNLSLDDARAVVGSAKIDSDFLD